PTVKLVATKYTRVEGDDVYYCPGVECEIEARSTSDLKANSFTWYNATNNVTDANTFGTDKTLIPTALTDYIDANGNSSYYVTAISEATGCTSLPSNTLYLKKIPVPAFSAYADPNTVCSGDQTAIKIAGLADASAYKFNIITKLGVQTEGKDEQGNIVMKDTVRVGAMFSTTTGEPVYNIANYASNAPYGVRLTTPDGCISDVAVSVTPTDGPIIDWELYNYSKGKVVAAHIHEMESDANGIYVPKKNADGSYVVREDAEYAYANANHRNNVSYYVYADDDTPKEHPQFGHFCVGDVYYLYVRNVRSSQPNEPAILADTFSVNVKGIKKRNGKEFKTNLLDRWVALDYSQSPSKNTHFPAVSTDGIHISITDSCYYADGSTICPSVTTIDLDVKQLNPTVSVIGVPNYICKGEEFSFQVIGRATQGSHIVDAKVYTTGSIYQALDYVSGPEGSAGKFKANVSDNTNWSVTTDGNYVWNARRKDGGNTVTGDAGLKFKPDANTAYYARVWDNYGCASNQWGRTVNVYDVPSIKLDYADPACENSAIRVLVNPNSYSSYYFREYKKNAEGKIVDMDNNFINDKSQVIDASGNLVYALDANGQKIPDDETEDPDDYKLKSPHPFKEGYGTSNTGNIYGALTNEFYNYRYFNSSSNYKNGDKIVYQVYATIQRTNSDDGSIITCPSEIKQVEFTPDQNPKIKAAFYNEAGEIKTTFCPGEKVTIKVGLANGEYFLDKAQHKNETYKNHSVTYYSNYAKIPAINFNNIVHTTTVPLNATMAPFAGETESYHLLDDQFSFIAPETPGTYTIKVTDKVTQSYSCPKDTNIVFTIAARPSVSLVAIRGNVDPTDANHVYICEGDSAILQANSTTSNCTYNWYAIQNGGQLTDLKYDKDTVKFAPSEKSTTRLVKIIDGQGCESDFSNEIKVEVAPRPSITIDKAYEYVCPSTPATVDIIASGANNWQFFTTNQEHTDYGRLGNGETTNSKYSLSKTIAEFNNGVYTGYVGVENRDAESISFGCKNFAEYSLKEAKTPVLKLQALRKTGENSYTEISTPCEGEEYYVKVVDETADPNSDATLKATLVLKGVDGAADEEISLNSDLISVSSFTADRRKRFSVSGSNNYGDGTSCASNEYVLDVKVNKIPTFTLNATAACEKTKRTYTSNDGGNYGAGNGKTKFSVSNLVLDKVSNTTNKVVSYTWEIQGSEITHNSSSYEHTYLSNETEAVARVTVTDANGCSSIPVEKISPLMKRPRQIVAAEAKCIGDNQVKITNTLDPTCGFSINEVDFWYRLYRADKANENDTINVLKKSLTQWMEGQSSTPRLQEFSGWKNAYPEHTFNTAVTGSMWACTRMRSVKSDNTCESEVECVLVQPSEKPTFTTVMKSGGYALNIENNTAKVCPSTPVVIEVNVTKFAAGCPEATITVKEANSTGHVIETKTVTSSSGIQTISLGNVTGNMDFIVEVSSSCGCLASDRYRINVLPTPTVSLVAEGSRIEDGYIYVCPNGTADLKALASSTVEITDYKWYENNSLHNSTSELLSGQGAGSYYVSVVDQNGCESSPSNTIVIEEVAVPTVSASAPEVVCEKTPFEINIDNPIDGITYVVYNPADDGTTSQTSARATIKKTENISSISVTIPSTYTFKSAADVFTVVAKNDRGCVSDPYQVKVEKAQKPSVTILAKKSGSPDTELTANLTVCPNDMVEFSLSNGATLYKGYTYTMTPSNTDVNVYGTNTERPTAQILDKKTVFTFSFESEAGCVSQGTYTVNVVSPKTLRITDNVVNRYDNKPIVCPGGKTDVTLTATNGIYVNWSNAGLPLASSAVTNDGHDPDVAATITFNPSVAQTYVFNGTDANGCAVTASYDILIANLVNMENIAVTLQPDDTPVTDLAVCENSTITLTASGSISNAKDGETIKNYDWFADEALTEPIGSGASISDFMTIADDSRNAEGFYADIQDVKSYWVRATSNFGCVSGKMKTTVTIDRTPEIKFKNSSEPCIDTQIEIIPNTGSSNQYFTITNLTSGDVYENVLTAPFVPEKAGQSYNFKVEAQRGACKAVEYTSINAKPLPIIKLFDAETGLSFMDACPDVDNVTSEHYLKFTVDGGRVTDIPTVTGASLASATNTFTFGNNTYDGNETDAYYANYSRPTALNSSIKVTAKGSNGCETTAEFPITIKPTPNKPEVTVLRNGLPTSDKEFCEGDKVTVIAKSTNDNDKTVSFNNGGAYGNKNGAAFDPQSGTAVFEFDAVSNSVSSDQTIKVSATNEDNCNSSKESVTITVSDKLDLKINNEPSGSTVKACVGSKEQLKVTAGGSPVNPADYSIEWFASDKSTSLSTEAIYEVEPDPVYSKTIWVKVKSKNALGCEEWTNITIAPVAVPSITIVAENKNTGKRVTSTSAESDSIVYCSGDASGLNISAIVPDGVTYKWDDGAENTDLLNKGGWTSTQTNVLTVTYQTESGLVCETKREFKTVVKEKPTIGVDAAAPDFITSVDANG
ncbi:MAG: hypothetical protein UH071_05265, partial [Paludibacteraceae bacterium]|nr:hypothetical protein [Paludibacteraceae bacterium]